MQKSFLFLLLLTAAQYSFAQIRRPQNKQEIIAVCDRFMEIFKNGKYQQAFAYSPFVFFPASSFEVKMMGSPNSASNLANVLRVRL